MGIGIDVAGRVLVDAVVGKGVGDEEPGGTEIVEVLGGDSAVVQSDEAGLTETTVLEWTVVAARSKGRFDMRRVAGVKELRTPPMKEGKEADKGD